ncbi:hypothetical protein [Gordonia paraffinivorans]|uniref:hypothetical protein n=1 Tax=Gordonia paraffinivorans TaxID=175628 RepID=UPI0024328826|nr:hypothetical protein [Gordonia paraffinivorans]
MTDHENDRENADLETPEVTADSGVDEAGAETPATDGSDASDAKVNLDKPAAPRGKTARRSASGPKQSAAEKTTESSTRTAETRGSDDTASGDKEFAVTITARGIRRAVGALLVIALIAAVGFLGWRTFTLQREADAFADAKTASADFVGKLVTTLNAENAGNSKELIGPLSTGELRKRLEQERDDTEQNVEALKIEVTSKINVVAVETVSTDTAKTVVLAEVTGRSVKLPTGGTSLMVFRLDLAKEDGKWLVSKVDGPPGAPSGQIDPSQSLPGGGAPQQNQPAPAPQPGG